MGWIHGSAGKDFYITFEELSESRQVCKACLERALGSYAESNGEIATHHLNRLKSMTIEGGHIRDSLDGLSLCDTEGRQKLIDEQKNSEAIKVAEEREKATTNASAILSEVVARVSCPECLKKISQEAGDIAYYHKYRGRHKWMDDNYGGGHLSYFGESSKFYPVCGADPYYGD